MNSKEEILKKHAEYYFIFSGETKNEDIFEFKGKILSAMDEYRSQGEQEMAIKFATWMEDGNFYRSEENGVRYYHKSREERYTKEQLYELFKQSL